jgi:hypothetical protein
MSVLHTSPAKSVLISPIPLSPTRNMICKRQSDISLEIWIYDASTDWNVQTFEKRLFSIFWAINNFKASGSVRSRMFFCLIFPSHHSTKTFKVKFYTSAGIDDTKPAELRTLLWTGIVPTFVCSTLFRCQDWENQKGSFQIGPNYLCFTRTITQNKLWTTTWVMPGKFQGPCPNLSFW